MCDRGPKDRHHSGAGWTLTYHRMRYNAHSGASGVAPRDPMPRDREQYSTPPGGRAAAGERPGIWGCSNRARPGRPREEPLCACSTEGPWRAGRGLQRRAQTGRRAPAGTVAAPGAVPKSLHTAVARRTLEDQTARLGSGPRPDIWTQPPSNSPWPLASGGPACLGPDRDAHHRRLGGRRRPGATPVCLCSLEPAHSSRNAHRFRGIPQAAQRIPARGRFRRRRSPKRACSRTLGLQNQSE